MWHLIRFPNLFLWKFLESGELCTFLALSYFCCSGLWSILSLFWLRFRRFAHFLFVYLFLGFFYEVLMVNLARRFSFVPRLRKHNRILTKRWLMRMMMIAAILALIIIKKMHLLLLTLNWIHDWISFSEWVHLNKFCALTITLPLIACNRCVALICESSWFLILEPAWASAFEIW